MEIAATGRYDAVIESFRDLSVAVVGDVCLDRYIFGKPSRMSREAPVVVLEWQREYSLPGEASNPALNIASLGGTAYIIGVTGQDVSAEELVTRLSSSGAHAEYLVSDPVRRTTEKIRILAEGLWVLPQQQARVDKLDTLPIGSALETELCKKIEGLGPQVDAFLLSDYKRGVISQRVISCALRVAREYSKLVTVDSQGHLYRFSGFDCVRCNRQEAEATLEKPLSSERDFERELPALHRSVGCNGLVVTRDGDGMSLYSSEHGYHHIPAFPVQVADAVGAGDTAISVLTLALAAGESLPSAAYMANRAAALVVQHVGNACLTSEELSGVLEP